MPRSNLPNCEGIASAEINNLNPEWNDLYEEVLL